MAESSSVFLVFSGIVFAAYSDIFQREAVTPPLRRSFYRYIALATIGFTATLGVDVVVISFMAAKELSEVILNGNNPNPIPPNGEITLGRVDHGQSRKR
jgi:hypothetical protein